jgi:hypothetical protein
MTAHSLPCYTTYHMPCFAAIRAVLGDLHGSRLGLEDALSGLQAMPLLGSSDRHVLFQMGDLGDRGPDSVLVTYALLVGKVIAGDQVGILRGNHEVRAGGWGYQHTCSALPLVQRIPLQCTITCA